MQRRTSDWCLFIFLSPRSGWTVVLAIGFAQPSPSVLVSLGRPGKRSRHLIKREVLGIRMQVPQSCGFLRHSSLHGGHRGPFIVNTACTQPLGNHTGMSHHHRWVSQNAPRCGPHFSRPTVIFVAPSLRDEKPGLTFIFSDSVHVLFTRMEDRKCLGSDHSPGAGTIIVKGEVCLQSREKEEKLTHNHRSPASVFLFFSTVTGWTVAEMEVHTKKFYSSAVWKEVSSSSWDLTKSPLLGLFLSTAQGPYMATYMEDSSSVCKHGNFWPCDTRGRRLKANI